MRRAIRAMKDGKAVGTGSSGLLAVMLKAAGYLGVSLMTELLNAVIQDCCVPEDWKRIIVVNVYKGRCNALERGNYQGIKLLDKVMNVLERVIAGMIRDKVCMDEMQFGFTPGRGRPIAGAIFILRQLQEK